MLLETMQRNSCITVKKSPRWLKQLATSARVRLLFAGLVISLGACRGAHGLDTEYVSSSKELYDALVAVDVRTAYLTRPVRLNISDWSAPISVSRIVTIAAHPEFKAIKVYITLDLASLAARVHLQPGAQLTFEGLELVNYVAELGQSMLLLAASPGARVAFHNVIQRRKAGFTGDRNLADLLALPRLTGQKRPEQEAFRLPFFYYNKSTSPPELSMSDTVYIIDVATPLPPSQSSYFAGDQPLGSYDMFISESVQAVDNVIPATCKAGGISEEDCVVQQLRLLEISPVIIRTKRSDSNLVKIVASLAILTVAVLLFLYFRRHYRTYQERRARRMRRLKEALGMGPAAHGIMFNGLDGEVPDWQIMPMPVGYAAADEGGGPGGGGGGGADGGPGGCSRDGGPEELHQDSTLRAIIADISSRPHCGGLQPLGGQMGEELRLEVCEVCPIAAEVGLVPYGGMYMQQQQQASGGEGGGGGMGLREQRQCAVCGSCGDAAAGQGQRQGQGPHMGRNVRQDGVGGSRGARSGVSGEVSGGHKECEGMGYGGSSGNTIAAAAAVTTGPMATVVTIRPSRNGCSTAGDGCSQQSASIVSGSRPLMMGELCSGRKAAARHGVGGSVGGGGAGGLGSPRLRGGRSQGLTAAGVDILLAARAAAVGAMASSLGVTGSASGTAGHPSQGSGSRGMPRLPGSRPAGGAAGGVADEAGGDSGTTNGATAAGSGAASGRGASGRTNSNAPPRRMLGRSHASEDAGIVDKGRDNNVEGVGVQEGQDVDNNDMRGFGGAANDAAAADDAAAAAGDSAASDNKSAAAAVTVIDELDALRRDIMAGINDTQLQIMSVVGSGAFGTVYRGQWQGLEVAVKTVVFSASSENRKRALQEAALCQSINHRNIVATYAVDVQPLGAVACPGGLLPPGGAAGQRNSTLSNLLDWRLYIVQEYCDGGPLRKLVQSQYLQTDSGPNMLVICEVALELAQALAHLHSKNVIHGDLNPNNVLLKRDASSPIGFRVKMADFGLSVMVPLQKTHMSNLRLGTLYYIAPETCFRGQLGYAADVFSLGVMLWELYHGRLAGTRTPTGEPRYQPDFPDFPASCPPDYRKLAHRCLQKQPHNRLHSSQVVQRLQEMLAAYREAAAAGPPRPPLPPLPRGGLDEGFLPPSSNAPGPMFVGHGTTTTELVTAGVTHVGGGMTPGGL